MVEDLLAAPDLSAIPHHEDVHHTRILLNDLRSIGQVFLDYGVHTQWGLCLLHRHYPMPYQHYMIHEVDRTKEFYEDTCRLRRLEEINQSIYPHSWYFASDGQLRPFEYDATIERDGFPNGFEDALRNILNARRLLEAISVVPVEGGLLLESLLPEIRGMRTVFVAPECVPVKNERTSDEVGWRFQQGSHGVEIFLFKECKVDIVGVHKPT